MSVLKCRHCQWEIEKPLDPDGVERAWRKLRSHIRFKHGRFDDKLHKSMEREREREAEFIRHLTHDPNEWGYRWTRNHRAAY